MRVADSRELRPRDRVFRAWKSQEILVVEEAKRRRLEEEAHRGCTPGPWLPQFVFPEDEQRGAVGVPVQGPGSERVRPVSGGDRASMPAMPAYR